MALEHKLAAGVKRHEERMKSHKERHGSSERKHSISHVEVHKLEKGFRVVAHHERKPGEDYMDHPGPIEEAHNSMHSAFKSAKSHLGGVDADEGEMEG